MLELAEDARDRRRLVMRAGSPSVKSVIRRVAATLLVIGWFVFVIAGSPPWAAYIGALLVAAMVLAIPPSEIREIEVDGERGKIAIRKRGVMCWFPSTTELALDRPITFAGGLPAEHAEHGLALSAGNERHVFTLAGVDRRDEVRHLAEALALCLGVGLEVSRDDLFLFGASLVPGGDPPVTHGGAYRQGPSPTLATHDEPAFEEPRNPPPPFDPQKPEAIEDRIVRFDPERGDYEMEAALQRRGVASRWLQTLAEHASYWAKRIGIASLVTAVVGAVIGISLGDGPWRGALIGMLCPPFVALAIGGGMAIGYLQVLLFVGLLYGGFILLHGSETSTPGRWVDITPRRWSLDAKSGTLELRGALFRRRLRLARASRLELARASDGTHALWLRVGWRWVRLVGTRPGAEGLASISGFAVAVARSVALPIRCHP